MFFHSSLEKTDFASVRALICVGLSKLLLAGLVTQINVRVSTLYIYNDR
jgi:hypothetical protein